jgi:hypothetical protein
MKIFEARFTKDGMTEH